LREPADAAARSTGLSEKLIEKLSRDRPLRIVDLGSGTGSNIRYLSPRLPQPHEWLAIDRDPTLLNLAPNGVTTRTADLGVLDGDLFEDRQLVTASALLDLVSEEWLRTMAVHCRRVKASALFALTYSGQVTCDPVEPEDQAMFDLFHRHQRMSDKGFGRAAGPGATRAAIRSFSDAGYEVRRAPSNWELGPPHAQLQLALIDGWAMACAEMDPSAVDRISRWRAVRLGYVHRGTSQISVGHWDVAAWPGASVK
jgi:hypothetical protein